jgi:uncharacterized protein (DUF488 family)
MDIVYTIGHSRHETDFFLNLLRKHKVDIVLDVRSAPYSVRQPQFNREILSLSLRDAKLAYMYLGEYFGARQPEGDYYTEDGWLQYRAFAKTHVFKEGINKLDSVLADGKVPALLCAEKDPFNCHRAIMIGHALAKQGYEVRHILEDGSLLSQQKLDIRLLDKYFPKRGEASIFDILEGVPDPEAMLDEAYDLRNEAIAWRKEQSEED